MHTGQVAGLAEVAAPVERHQDARPLDVLAAHGHGRSYGNWSRVLVRALPGIGVEEWRDPREIRSSRWTTGFWRSVLTKSV